MLLTLFVLGVLCAIVFSFVHKKVSDYSGYDCGFAIGACAAGVASLIILIIALCNLPEILPIHEKKIDEKISMYQQENERIEAEMDVMVDSYMQYETDIIDSVVDGKSSSALVAVFPELKSDTLVQKQLDVYLENNEKIKELKAEKIELARKRWLVYFGN